MGILEIRLASFGYMEAVSGALGELSCLLKL
jgi:hypothetical protein